MHMQEVCRGWPETEEVDEEGGGGCVVRFEVDAQKLYDRGISLRTAAMGVCRSTGLSPEHVRVPFADEEGEAYMRVHVPAASELWARVSAQLSSGGGSGGGNNPRVVALTLAYNLHCNVQVHGEGEITNFLVDFHPPTDRWVVTTLGSCLDRVVCLDEVDPTKTVSSDVAEMERVYGVASARRSLENELLEVMAGMADARHVGLIARMMVSDARVKGMKIKQLGGTLPPLQRAAFEQGPKQMVQYCSRAERDFATTICGAAITNKLMAVGTGYALDLVPRPPPVMPPDARLPPHMETARLVEFVHSPKVDGTRADLMFVQERDGSNMVSLVDRRFDVYSLPASGILPTGVFAGTTLAGDMVRRADGTHLFVVVDCVMSCGHRCAHLRYDQRLEIAREVLHQLATQGNRAPLDAVGGTQEAIDLGASSPFCLPICNRRHQSSHVTRVGSLPFGMVVKPVFRLSSLQTFADEWIRSGKYPLPTDGFVFTDLFAAAYPFSMRPLSVFKWKPRNSELSENSIDFVVTPAPTPGQPADLPAVQADVDISRFRNPTGTVHLWVRHTRSQSLLLFSAAEECDIGCTSGVVECAWHFQKRRWQGMRVRRKDANTVRTAVCTVQNIVEDIQLSDII
jgi:hypothetical protein